MWWYISSTIWNVNNFTNYSLTDEPTNVPTATTVEPTVFPTRLPSRLPTVHPSTEPTAKTHCVNSTIDSDVHTEDISWSLKTGDGFGNYNGVAYNGSYGDYVNATEENGCIDIAEKCFWIYNTR